MVTEKTFLATIAFDELFDTNLLDVNDASPTVVADYLHESWNFVIPSYIAKYLHNYVEVLKLREWTDEPPRVFLRNPDVK